MNDSKRELLQKLKALAEQGLGGEKENAQKMLSELMRKYGVSEEELSDDHTQPYEFKCKTDIEEKLLCQTIYKVTNSKHIYGFTRVSTGRHVKHKVGCECTKAQKIEIEFLFDFYKRTFAKDLETLISAFIQKHQIFGDLQDGEEPQAISREEAYLQAMMQQGMCDDKPQKQIEGGGGDGNRS